MFVEFYRKEHDLMLSGGISKIILSGVDAMVDKDPSGDLVFSVIGLSRAVQGVCVGMLFVIVQVCI